MLGVVESLPGGEQWEENVSSYYSAAWTTRLVDAHATNAPHDTRVVQRALGLPLNMQLPLHEWTCVSA